MKFWFHRGVWTRKHAEDKIKNLANTDIKSIAIIRHAALGDMVLTRSFIIEARKAFPNANITLSVVSNYTRGIPKDLVDRVHIIHGSDQRNVSLREQIKRIRELGYNDIIFDLAATNRSIKTCLLNKSRLKIGFPYRILQARLVYDIAICRSDLSFEVNDMLNMLHIFGAKTAYPHRYNMPGSPLKRQRPYIVYFAGASTPVKCWPTSHFSKLISRMSSSYPEHEHLLLEGILDWEKGNSEAILTPLKDNQTIQSVQANTIEQTTALLMGADLVVANDTGIRHVAIVSNTPTVGIFFYDPYRYWPRYDIHEVALPEVDGPPEVDEVYSMCTRVLNIHNKA